MNNARNWILMAGLMLAAGSANAVGLSGAGATFPAPVYKKWAAAYSAKHSGIEISYGSYGSGEGIKRIQAKSVDFGASDKPLKPEELAQAGLVQFPTVIGGVVPVINVAGIENGKLRLDGPTLANIYLGKITKWNDPAIVALNKDLKLPDANIAVIHRSDSSGTTFIFTNYLSKVSAEWKSAVGEGTSVSWKVGSNCRGNTLMPVCVFQTVNSIAYIEHAYATRNMMSMVQMKNHDGQFLAPSDVAFQAAAGQAKWDPAAGFYAVLTDQPGAGSWPIAGATYILMNKEQDKPEKAREVLRFFDWAYVNGNTMASELGFVPLPDKVQQLIRETWITKITDASSKASIQAVAKK